MRKRARLRKEVYRVAAAVLGVFIVLLFLGSFTTEKVRKREINGGNRLLADFLEHEVITFWIPLLHYAQGMDEGSFLAGLGMPFLFSYLEQETEIVLQTESIQTMEEIIRAEGRDETVRESFADSMEPPRVSDGKMVVSEDMEKALLAENKTDGQQKESDITKVPAQGTKTETQTAAGQDAITTEQESATAEVDVTATEQESIVRKQRYQWEYYENYEELVNEFFVVDASTMADDTLLDVQAFLAQDLSVEKRTDDQPQILIYHTHSQEWFADTVKGDPATTIMGVGQVLARILQDQYGYNVMHHLGQYDVENRDYAYNTALPYLEQLLEENPTIEVVIDLHRDQVDEGTKLLTTIDGRPTARFMFFNGLSQTKKLGKIGYLPNENLQKNLAFSFQMQALCNQYYPGLTRRIYLKGYRYNMHLKARYLLVEMGAQTNSYQECYNACIPLAKILDMELSGASF
ncbi:MAG: stage II sporulation protein P [Lachnospiraceae bacterium]|nr:stage II sporulation protein P [Lachnospiraceae bacterium]